MTKNELRQLIKETIREQNHNATGRNTLSKSDWLAAYDEMSRAINEFISLGGSYDDNFNPSLSDEINNMDGRLQNVLKQYSYTAKRVRESLRRQR